MRYQGPQRNFILGRAVNPGDNSGVEFHSHTRLWDPAPLGSSALLTLPCGDAAACMAPTSALVGLEWIFILRKNWEPGSQEVAQENAAKLRSLQLQVCSSHPALYLAWNHPGGPSPSPPGFSNRRSRNTWDAWTRWEARGDRIWDQGGLG